jgi:hypothetical protein
LTAISGIQAFAVLGINHHDQVHEALASHPAFSATEGTHWARSDTGEYPLQVAVTLFVQELASMPPDAKDETRDVKKRKQIVSILLRRMKNDSHKKIIETVLSSIVPGSGKDMLLAQLKKMVP